MPSFKGICALVQYKAFNAGVLLEEGGGETV